MFYILYKYTFVFELQEPKTDFPFLYLVAYHTVKE